MFIELTYSNHPICIQSNVYNFEFMSFQLFQILKINSVDFLIYDLARKHTILIQDYPDCYKFIKLTSLKHYI